MSGLLIVIVLLMAFSPLMWLKQSPQQKRLAALRQYASTLSLQVSLHRRPDAREQETSLRSVCYRLSWLDSDCGQTWVLQRFSQRGWDSHCSGWRWVLKEAPADWQPVLADIIPQMCSGVSAVIASETGIGVIWDERGDTSDIDEICDHLHQLRKKAKEIYI